MPDITITLANDRQVTFTVRDDGEGPPCFLLGVRKCGSTVTNQICIALAEMNRRCFVEVGHTFFTHNVPAMDWHLDPALRQLLRPGVIYGGFRNAPLVLLDHPDFVAAPKLLMIRDPRDALISEYFSNAYSHSLPPPTGDSDAVSKMIATQRARALAENIQGYVMSRAKPMAVTMQRYEPVLSMPNTLVVKYEDVILRKAELIDHLARHFGMHATPQNVEKILQWADVLPIEEDPRAFVRQVLPGDHAKKLDQPTIDQLNQALAAPMKLFGYAA